MSAQQNPCSKTISPEHAITPVAPPPASIAPLQKNECSDRGTMQETHPPKRQIVLPGMPAWRVTWAIARNDPPATATILCPGDAWSDPTSHQFVACDEPSTKLPREEVRKEMCCRETPAAPYSGNDSKHIGKLRMLCHFASPTVTLEIHTQHVEMSIVLNLWRGNPCELKPCTRFTPAIC